jgi:endonuclease YncB( thermonuclease family)
VRVVHVFAVLIAAAQILSTITSTEGSDQVRVKDADTLVVDGMTFRLHGVDAPERDQVCLDTEGELYICGQIASAELEKFIAGRAVACEDLHADPVYGKRRIGRCSVGGIDLQHWLELHGWALNFEPYAKSEFG